MKFNGNPVDLGLSYHTFTEIENGDGTSTIRYVLTEKLSPADKEELGKYENVKFIEKGAKYKYDPNITYDTLYITIPDREIANEDFEDEHLGNSDYSLMDSKRFSDEDDSMEILAQLDEEVNAPITSEIDSNAKYSYLAQGINIENESIVYYDQLMTMFPEWTPVLQDIKKEELKHIGQLQTLLNQNPEVAQNFQEGIVEGEKQIVGNPMADSATEAIDEEFEELAENFWESSDLGDIHSLKEVEKHAKYVLDTHGGKYGKYTDYRKLAKDMLKYEFMVVVENFWDGSGLGNNPSLKDVEEYAKYFLDTYDGQYCNYTDYRKLAKDMLEYEQQDDFDFGFDSATESFDEYDEKKMEALEDIVVKKIQNNRKFDDETKEELIGDIRVDGLVEFMGFELYENGDWVKNPEMEHVLDSEEEMIKAADKYIGQLEESLLE